MEHKILKIQQDIQSLTKEDWEHIENCKKCLDEYKIMKLIENSIQEIPEVKVSYSIEKIMAQTFYKPRYSFFHLIIVSVILVFFPFFLKDNDLLFFQWITPLVIYITVIYLAILVILSIYIFHIKKEILEQYSEKIDTFIEKKLMKI